MVRRIVLWIIAGVVIVAVLWGAVFVVGPLLPIAPPLPPDPIPVMNP